MEVQLGLLPSLPQDVQNQPHHAVEQISKVNHRALEGASQPRHTRHVPLNAYLHRINKIDIPLCPSCGLDSESVHHYLFDCLVWRAEHWRMGKALHEAKSLWQVLSSEKGVGELLGFLGRTE